MPFSAMWMDLEIAILSEVSQTEKNIVWHPLYVESKKYMMQMNLQKRNTPTDLDNELMAA